MKFIKKNLKLISGLALSVGAIAISNIALAADDVPTATSTLNTIMTTVINTTVGLVVTVFQVYWPYILVFGIISGLVAAFMKFAHLGSGRGK